MTSIINKLKISALASFSLFSIVVILISTLQGELLNALSWGLALVFIFISYYFLNSLFKSSEQGQ